VCRAKVTTTTLTGAARLSTALEMLGEAFGVRAPDPRTTAAWCSFWLRRSARWSGELRLANVLCNYGQIKHSGELLGEPSAELRAKMADSEVRLFTPFLSM
jgi:hypothetical protein